MPKRLTFSDRIEMLFSTADLAQPVSVEETPVSLLEPLGIRTPFLLDNIELVARVSGLINQNGKSVEHILGQITREISNSLGGMLVEIYATDAHRDALALKASAGQNHGNVPSSDGALSSNQSATIRRAIRTKQTAITAPVSDDASACQLEIASPVLAGERVFGAIYLAYQQSGILDRTYSLILEALANQLGLAYERERLAEDAQSAREERDLRKPNHNGYHKVQGKAAWNDYLNGLDRAEQIGFTFSENEVRPSSPPDSSPDASQILTTALTKGDGLPGLIQIEGIESQSWTSDEKRVIENVARQITQHLENLRLIEEAEKYRSEAEQAARRLTHEGWEDYLNAIDRSEHIGFTYDQVKVETSSDGISTLPQNGAIARMLQVSGEPVGLIQVEPDENQAWSDQAENLTTLVSRQVSQHVENLRLLARSEKYRKEAETAARRLEKESWEEYLRTQSPRNQALGFVYDQNTVQPIDLTVVEIAPTLSIPLQVREETVGEILVDEPQSDEARSGTLMSTIAMRLAQHVESLRLLEETERGRQQLNKRAAELETVARVSTAAATILSEFELAQAVVDLTQANFNLYHAEIYLLDELDQNLYLVAGSGDIGRSMLADPLKLSIEQAEWFPVRVAQSRSALVIDDTAKFPEYHPPILLPDIKSAMFLPMVVGDRLLGVFAFLSRRTDTFTSEEMNVYTTLASQVAVAIQNARLYSEQMETVERLRELDQMKSSFLANMSHELRTPLNSILGFTQLIMEGIDGPVPTGMQSDLLLIEKNGRHLLNLINDVLDMAKIESGRVNLFLEQTDPIQLINETIETTSTLARAKAITLSLSQVTDKLPSINIDRTRIRQVFINLVGNAIKFTEKGEIRIEVEKLDGMIQFRIRDTGIGIPVDKLESIFEAFSQVDSSMTRKVGGTGLGLPISRRLVELHHGKLWAMSTNIPGEGSVFYLNLPLDLALTSEKAAS